MTLTTADRPEGQRDDYWFIEDARGQRFKALHELRENDKGDYVLVISIAPVDAAGKALRVGEDVPDVLYHTHTFTKTELADPAFDSDARIRAIMQELVERKTAEMVARAVFPALGERWRSGAIKLEGGTA